MREVQRWGPRLAAVALAATTVTASDQVGDGGSATASHYMVLAADLARSEDIGHRTGCLDARAGVPGPRLLFFGAQESGDRVRPPGTTPQSPVERYPLAAVERAAVGWARGYQECGGGEAVVALAASNKPGPDVDGGPAGTAWAGLVDRVAAAVGPGPVSVAAGMDAEPAWGGMPWARGWVDGYVAATRRPLYAAGSADGCPTGEPGERCDNGWTVADVHHVSTGASDTVYAMPQVYRTDGIQARQWAWVSRWGVRSGQGPLRVAGALSQEAACRQKSGCARTANPPEDALRQLCEALAGDPGTTVRPPLVATDVSWPEPLPQEAFAAPEHEAP